MKLCSKRYEATKNQSYKRKIEPISLVILVLALLCTKYDIILFDVYIYLF